jgi:hypothetical protein
MADFIYVVQMDIPRDLEDDFNRVYDTQHVPAIMKVPGVHGCTRYVLESALENGGPRYAAVYEVASPDVVMSPEWRAASDTGDWKPRIRPHTTNRIRCLYRKLT